MEENTVTSNIYMSIWEYPIGTTVCLKDDEPEDEPHEVIGYKQIVDSTYIIFKDGTEKNVDQITHIHSKGIGSLQTKSAKQLLTCSILCMIAALISSGFWPLENWMLALILGALSIACAAFAGNVD